MSEKFLQKKIKENNFLIVGRAGIDIYPEPPGTKTENAKNFISHLGGSSANIAVALTKLGGKCKLLTKVSNDALGKLTLNELNKYNINTSLIKFQKKEARISLAIVESRVEDHQSIIYRHHAADLYLNEKDIIEANIENFSCLLITGTALAAEPSRSAIFLALEIAANNKIPVIMDIDYRPYTWKSINEASEIYLKAAKLSNGVIGNDDEFGVLANNYNDGYDLAESLSENIDFIIYKKGEKGSVTFTKNNKFTKGIFPVVPLKPTGAGDAYMGAFIGALLNNHKIEQAVEIGSAAAAIVVTKVGCAPAMPDFNEINNFINNNNIT